MKGKIDYQQLLVNRAYDPTKEPPPDEIVLRIEQKNIGSFQNFITITGRQKQGKGRYLSGIIASALTRREIFGIYVRLPIEKNKIILIDTEQGNRDFFVAMETARKLAGLPNLNIPQFKAYTLREDDPVTIRHAIQQALTDNPDSGILIIDGLLDLLNSYNDEAESKQVVQLLKKWSKIYNMLIIAVIHLGKSSNNTIGHVGSMADRAAQSVLVVEKIKERGTYQLRSEYLRSADDFTPIEIWWNNSSQQWEQTFYNPEMDEKVRPIRLNPSDIDKDNHRQSLARVFSAELNLGYKDLVQAIKEVYIQPEKWARQCVQHLIGEQLLFKTSTGYCTSNKVKLFIEQ